MTQRLSIVSVAGGYGGAERSIEILLRHAPPDLAITVYCTNADHYAELSKLAAAGAWLRLVRLSAGEGAWSRRIAALRLVRDLRGSPPHPLVVNTHSSAMLAAMAARLVPGLGSRTSLFVHDFQWRSLDHIVSRLAGARILVPHRVVLDRLGYLNPWYLPDAEAHSPVVIPAMVEPTAQTPRYDGPLLHLAALNGYKGHTDLLLAAHRLFTTDRPVRIASHGHVYEAGLHRALLAFFTRSGLPANQFSLGPHLADPAALLARCRAVLVPSVTYHGGPETFSRSLLEGWAHGKPVIAYATGAPAHLIAHEVDGLLVPEGDVDGLAAAMHRLWTDEPLARRLGEAGRAKVLAHYQAETVARQFYRSLGLA